MADQEINLSLQKLEEFYNPLSPHYKFQYKNINFSINSKEELMMKFTEQKRNLTNLLLNIKIIKNRKENLKILKKNVESKLVKVMKQKRLVFSNCEDVNFCREKIQKRDSVILNDAYEKTLEEINVLLKEIKVKIEK